MLLKKLGKNILCLLLENQTKRLRRKYAFTLVAVGGSVGKTSTKLAIAKTLSATLRVRYQEGNYNDRLTVPLVLFGHVEPSIFNIAAWLRIVVANERILHSGYDVDVAVVELGTDGPGQMKRFTYLRPELFVLSAIAAEHMEYFKNLQAVAAEELSMLPAAKQSLLNLDDIAAEYLPSTAYKSYSLSGQADYRLATRKDLHLAGQELSLQLAETPLDIKTHILGEQGAKIILAAAATAHLLGRSADQIKQGLNALTPVPGRMQILPGIHGSSLIDDTYNASPVAVKAALDMLYGAEAEQRIAILGSMNELGTESAAAHQEVGAYCDAAKLQLVVTIGADAESYLAPAAKAAGCEVVSFGSPYEAGEYVKEHLQKGALVLAKGSQNGVFAEEALKLLLADPTDASKLVRQSPYWLSRKRKQFPS